MWEIWPEEKEDKYVDGLKDGLSEKKPLRDKYESTPGAAETKVRVPHNGDKKS